jgi:hypothetical protein
MLRRLVISVLTAVLVTWPAGSVVAPGSAVVFADSGYCEYAVSAHAYVYEDGSHVGASDASGVYLDGETPDHCAAVGQNYAIAHAGNACGGYEPGTAYAVVEWRVWWNGEEIPGSPVLQQYDCGHV